MRQYLHDNTVLHSLTHYTLNRGKRSYSDKPIRDRTKAVFTMEITCNAPLLMLPIAWSRYGYTLADVNTVYEKMDASYIWIVALLILSGLYEPESASAGVRSTFQSYFTFLFISRKTVFESFLATQQNHISPGNHTVLAHERTDHKPLLPVVPVPASVFELWRLHLPTRRPTFRYRVDYLQAFTFKDIQLVPVEYDAENQLVEMTRILPLETYNQLDCKPKQCVVTLPIHVTVAGRSYVLLNESCFLRTHK